jgi:hypothetical protein
MATVKRFNTTYTLDGPTVTVTGNLNVLGSTTAIETTNTSLKDNVIVLNDGEAGLGVTLGSAGILIDRGLLANVQLRWYETYQQWQVTSDGTVYSNLVTGSTALINDLTPTLGANLNTYQYSIASNVGNINFAGNLQINNTAVTPGVVANATVVYASTPGAGTSGIYVVNGSAANQELITKSRAFGFSLIL